MELLASLFVGKPVNILVVAGLYFAGYLAVRFTARTITRRSRSLLIASAAWGLYAAWEWLVHVKTPEANIRADLLLMWPLLAIISGWAIYRLFR